jgi:hypothetical protein
LLWMKFNFSKHYFGGIYSSRLDLKYSRSGEFQYEEFVINPMPVTFMITLVITFIVCQNNFVL